MNSQEAAVVVDADGQPIFWHDPPDRTVVSLPDSRKLWDVLWTNRKTLSGVAHSHPGSGPPAPSWTDLTTFAAIEEGLGVRLAWWITTDDVCRVFVWGGGDKHNYVERPMYAEPVWLPELRRLSKAAVLRGQPVLVAMLDVAMNPNNGE
jgi:hypothetical protein